MKNRLVGLIFVSVLASAMMLVRSEAVSQSVPANKGGPTKAATVGATFKNIQVLTDLKDAPVNDLYGVMQFMSGSLSVSCNYCHVSQQGPYDSDAKKTKLIARDMIKMMRAINQNNFGGRPIVTCNTCHRGSPSPKGTPSPWDKSPDQIAAYIRAVQPSGPNSAPVAGQPASPPTETGAALPDVDQVLANYRKAVGTKVVKSLHVLASTLFAQAGTVPFEAYAIFPDRILTRSAFRGTEIQTVLNGERGWRRTPQGWTTLPPDQFQFVRFNLESVLLPVKYEKSETPRKVAGIEEIGDRPCYVIEARTTKQSQRFFFDVQSGLLQKVRTEIETPFGVRVEEKTFDDYRDVNGVKLPFAITSNYMEDQQVFRISEVQINIDVDPAQFQPPAPK